MSTLTAFGFIQNRSEATPELWNRIFSTLSDNIRAVGEGPFLSTSTDTLSFQTNLNISGNLGVAGRGLFGAVPSVQTTGTVTISVPSTTSDYIHFEDTSGSRSDYLLGSRVGGTADGLNLWDLSGNTMLVSFSKQSIRFYQNVVGPVFDVGGALADTYNAATFGTGAQSIESRIQAAISQASIDGISRVYVPANMYPYSAASVSFDTRVQMVREGGNWSVHDVWAYGAGADFIRDDTAAINGAVSVASGSGGGVVFLPRGNYLITAPIIMPTTETNPVPLVGEGRRIVTIRPAASVHTAIISGTSGFNNLYPAFADFRVAGLSVSSHTGCGIHLIRPQTYTVNNITVEGFDGNNGSGIFVEGKDSVEAGVHAWQGSYHNVLVATCRRPFYAQNMDETNFYSCIFNLPTNCRSAVTALEITQGRNNRFYGVLCQGDSSDFTNARPNYTGVRLNSAVTGDNRGHQFYGAVMEGHNSGISIGSAVSDVWIMNYNASICSVPLTDAGDRTVHLAPVQPTGVGLQEWPAGSAIAPAFAFRSEGSLGFYRSAASTIAWSYGSLVVNRVRIDAGSAAAPSLSFFGSPTAGLFDAGGGIMGLAGVGAVAAYCYQNQIVWNASGSALLPSQGWQSERSLGFYRSGASTLAVSYGTFLVNGPVWASGISVGPGGTQIPQISSTSSLVAAFVVQPSASSFTHITWAAVGAGDHIITTILPDATASSLSSGLVLHSHATIAGRFEMRLSNVSTLAQNQSSKTYYFTRIRPF